MRPLPRSLAAPTHGPVHRIVAGIALTLAATVLPAAPVSASPAAAPAAAPAARRSAGPVDLTRWDTTGQLASGHVRGAVVGSDRVRFGTPGGTRRLAGTTYDVASWTSPWTSPGADFTQLIASWEARTRGHSLVEIKVRGRDAAGRRSSWDVLGRWADGDKHVRRSSAGRQADDLARVDVDTWSASSSAGLRTFQVRVALMRRAGGKARPWVDTVHVMTSRLSEGAVPTSRPRRATRGTVLPVPRLSQMRHSGHYPRWGGGGQAWCSPTSTSMVLAYYDALPRRRKYDWVPEGHRDRVVDHGARMTYDYRYDGTGNWPFNTAYAAPRAGDAFVTRLTSLRQAERFIAAGIPLVASVSFRRGELSGAPISSTNGHLLVIVGFTESGDVVVNDPASSTRRGVRRSYDRGQFENVWIPRSGGLVYVIHDAAHPLPKGPGNW